MLGIVLMVGGHRFAHYPFFASVAAVIVFGVSLLLSGMATIVTAFWAGR